jgi:FtsZ-interacting cell division protein ZipA
MEIRVILILVGCVAWIVWAVRRDKQEFEKESLDRAWRKVRNDPHYMERRHREERERVGNARFDADNR